MKKSLWGFLAIILSLAISSNHALAIEKNNVNNPWLKTANQADSFSQKNNFAQDHILVKMKNGSVQRQALKANQSIEQAITEWNNNKDVDYVELDSLYYVLAQSSSWGYSTIKASQALTTNGVNGSGIIVAVIDTGVDYNHEDLDANNWINSDEIPDNNIDDDGNGYVDDYYGYDFIGSMYTSITPDHDPQDEYGHGTHVAGIIAAEDNSVGTVGVASLANIMPVKVLDSNGYGFDSSIADGIRYAVDNGANIINMSLGGSMASHTISDAIDYAESNNVLVIAAAGNSNSYSSPSYPAAYAGVVSVAASTELGYKASYSNWGKVDVTAPGDDILSATPGNAYARYSGTSMAAPHAAGVAALIMQKQGSKNAMLARHILETTTDDFGTQSGTDYVSGRGMINALSATTIQTASYTYLYADAGSLITDGSDDIVIYASERNSAGAAIVGDTVTWSVDKGTFSAASSTTNANGIASITMTADDVSGLATISASTTQAGATNMQIALLDDVVRPEDIGATEIINTSDTVNNESIIQGGSEISTDEESTEATVVTTELSKNHFVAGEQLYFWAYAQGRDKQIHEVVMTYSVTNPDGEAVSDLSGSSEKINVGEAFYIWYFHQKKFLTKPLTIPSDAISGKYKLTIITTDQDTLETSSKSMYFWVNEKPEILLVDNQAGCSDTGLEGLDFGGITSCSNAGMILADSLESLGYETVIWDTTDLGYPLDTDLKLFPLVIWADTGLAAAESFTLQSYLDAGGNLLFTSDNYASTYSGYGSMSDSFAWNYLHARFISSQQLIDQVKGVSNGLFTGLSFNTDFYNLNGNGAHNNFYADEIEINTADSAEALFQYNVGQSTNKHAGVRVDNGTYRVAYLPFSLEAINDATTGNATKGYVLSNLVDYLLGDAPSISSVTKKKLKNNKDRTITVSGSNFQLTGLTTVKLGETELSNVVVLDRSTLTATVPAAMPKGRYDLSIINPDGQTINQAEAVRIIKGPPVIESVSANFVANNKDQEIIITGQNFKGKVKAFLGKNRIKKVTFNGPTEVIITIKKDFKPGKYLLKLKNSSGGYGKYSEKFSVRYGFTENLKKGDNQEAVKYLENRLNNYGYLDGEPDNSFNTATKEALMLYQQAHSIAITGNLDFITRYSLNTVE